MLLDEVELSRENRATLLEAVKRIGEYSKESSPLIDYIRSKNIRLSKTQRQLLFLCSSLTMKPSLSKVASAKPANEDDELRLQLVIARILNQSFYDLFKKTEDKWQQFTMPIMHSGGHWLGYLFDSLAMHESVVETYSTIIGIDNPLNEDERIRFNEMISAWLQATNATALVPTPQPKKSNGTTTIFEEDMRFFAQEALPALREAVASVAYELGRDMNDLEMEGEIGYAKERYFHDAVKGVEFILPFISERQWEAAGKNIVIPFPMRERAFLEWLNMADLQNVPGGMHQG